MLICYSHELRIIVDTLSVTHTVCRVEHAELERQALASRAPTWTSCDAKGLTNGLQRNAVILGNALALDLALPGNRKGAAYEQHFATFEEDKHIEDKLRLVYGRMYQDRVSRRVNSSITLGWCVPPSHRILRCVQIVRRVSCLCLRLHLSL